MRCLSFSSRDVDEGADSAGESALERAGGARVGAVAGCVAILVVPCPTRTCMPPSLLLEGSHDGIHLGRGGGPAALAAAAALGPASPPSHGAGPKELSRSTCTSLRTAWCRTLAVTGARYVSERSGRNTEPRRNGDFAPFVSRQPPAARAHSMSTSDLLDFGGAQQGAEDNAFSSDGFHFASEGAGPNQATCQQLRAAAGLPRVGAPRAPGPGMEPPAAPTARALPPPGPVPRGAPPAGKPQQAATRRRGPDHDGARAAADDQTLVAKRRRVEASSRVEPRGEHQRSEGHAAPPPANGDPASMARTVAAETHALDVEAATLEGSLRDWAERSREQLAGVKRAWPPLLPAHGAYSPSLNRP